MLLVSHFVPLITNTMTSETRRVESSTSMRKFIAERPTYLLFETLIYLSLILLILEH